MYCLAKWTHRKIQTDNNLAADAERHLSVAVQVQPQREVGGSVLQCSYRLPYVVRSTIDLLGDSYALVIYKLRCLFFFVVCMCVLVTLTTTWYQAHNVRAGNPTWHGGRYLLDDAPSTNRGIATLMLSVRMSVTLRYRGHIGWVSSKIIKW